MLVRRDLTTRLRKLWCLIAHDHGIVLYDPLRYAWYLRCYYCGIRWEE